MTPKPHITATPAAPGDPGDAHGGDASAYSAYRLFQMALVGLGMALLSIRAEQAVAIAAALAWAVFLSVLLGTSPADRRNARVLVCLDTAMWGIIVLIVGLALGSLSWPWLLASQAVMALVFLLRRRELGLSLGKAAALWFLVLDGVYVAVYFAVLAVQAATGLEGAS
ncbi:MAG: hypothetical protein AAF078_11200 [Planctomycetota bacterium]